MSTLSFWGAAGTVTGSKYLIETDHASVLVDCGLFQGGHELRDRNWQEPPFNAASVDAVIITHAHIDHTGYLPRFVRHGFRGPIYCSRGTADLLKILLPDAARLQEEEADFRNRHKITKHLPALPLYTEQDARETLKLLQVVQNTGQPFPGCERESAQSFASPATFSARVTCSCIWMATKRKSGACCFPATSENTISRSFAIPSRRPRATIF